MFVARGIKFCLNGRGLIGLYFSNYLEVAGLMVYGFFIDILVFR